MNRISISEIKKENAELKKGKKPVKKVPGKKVKPDPKVPGKKDEPPIEVPGPHTTTIYNIKIGKICNLIKHNSIDEIILCPNRFSNNWDWTIDKERLNRFIISYPNKYMDRVEKDIKKKLSDERISIEVYSRNSKTMSLRKKAIYNKVFCGKKRMKG